MTLAQALFIVALIVVLLAVAGFAAGVVAGAARGGAGSFITPGLLGRMVRSPAERAEVDRWAFYAHRISGFAVFAFLALHVCDVGLYGISHRLYDQVHQLYGTAPLRVFECGLLFGILFHTFNGLRILAIDLADLRVVTSRRLLAGAFALTVVLGLLGSAVILRPVFA